MNFDDTKISEEKIVKQRIRKYECGSGKLEFGSGNEEVGIGKNQFGSRNAECGKDQILILFFNFEILHSEFRIRNGVI